MNRVADTVAAEFGYDVKAAATDFTLDGTADVSRGIACARSTERLMKSAFRTTRQLGGDGIFRRNLHGDGGVRVITILFGGEIELDEIAGLQCAAAGNSVNDFLVDADARVTGKAINQRRRRSRTMLGKHVCGNTRQFGGSDPSADLGGHGRESFGDDAATGAKLVELVGTGDGHGLIVLHELERIGPNRATPSPLLIWIAGNAPGRRGFTCGKE